MRYALECSLLRNVNRDTFWVSYADNIHRGGLSEYDGADCLSMIRNRLRIW